MVSSEFVDAINKKNEMRIHILLKDSLLVDKSFRQFDEMVRYANIQNYNVWMKSSNPGVINGESEANLDTLNEELTLLVEDFTQERVRRIQQIIRILYPTSIPAANLGVNNTSQKSMYDTPRNDNPKRSNSNSYYEVIDNCSREIRRRVKKSKDNEQWLMEDIRSIEHYAKQVEEAANRILKGETK